MAICVPSERYLIQDTAPMERKTMLWQSATKILFLRNIIRNLNYDYFFGSSLI
jgi:hypothetical protein